MIGPPDPRSARSLRLLLALAAPGALLLLGTVACAPAGSSASVPPAAAAAQTSTSCRECDAEAFQAWSGTDHALANRPVDPARDREAFAAHPRPAAGGSEFALAWTGSGPRLTELRAGEPPVTHPARFIPGAKPLWQPLTENFTPGERYADHFRLTLPVDAGTFYPDGQ